MFVAGKRMIITWHINNMAQDLLEHFQVLEDKEDWQSIGDINICNRGLKRRGKMFVFVFFFSFLFFLFLFHSHLFLTCKPELFHFQN